MCCFLKKILFSKSSEKKTDQAPSSGFSLWGDQDVPLREGIGRSPCKPKNVNFLWRAFSVTQTWLIWKSLMNLGPLIQNSVLQDYLPELHLRYLPSYQKCPLLWYCLFAPTRCGLSPPLPLDLYEKLWSWGEGGVGVGILPNNQKFSHFPHHKNPPSCIYIFCYQKCHSFPIK